MQKIALIGLSTLVILMEVSFTQSATAASRQTVGTSIPHSGGFATGHSSVNLIAKACTIRRYRRPR
jgi:hypothetical protein